MILEHIPAGPLMVNCYILGDEDSGEAVVIDPGGNVPDILNILNRRHLRPTAIVNTHGHWDHTGGDEKLKNAAGGRILIHAKEHVRDFKPDEYIQEGDIIRFGRHELHVLDTPGHSPGGVSLHLPDANLVFVGDLLFAGSIGRTDLGGGSMETLLRSIKTKIFPLGDGVKVMPGHGPATTVLQEKRTNPFLRGL